MRTFSKSFLFKIFLGSLLLVGIWGIKPEQAAAACRFGDVKFSQVNLINYQENKPTIVTADVNVFDCEGKTIEIKIFEDDSLYPDIEVVEVTKTYSITKRSRRFLQSYIIGETGCDAEAGADCDYEIRASVLDGSTTVISKTSDEIGYEMIGIADQPWQLGSFKEDDAVSSDDYCQIENLKIEKIDPTTGNRTPVIGDMSASDPNFYTDLLRPKISITGEFVGCGGVSSYAGLVATAKTFSGGTIPRTILSTPQASSLFGGGSASSYGITPKTDVSISPDQGFISFEVPIVLGENECEGIEGSRKCTWSFLTREQVAEARSDVYKIKGSPAYTSQLQNKGYHFSYDCEAECDEVTYSEKPTAQYEDGEPIDLLSNPFVKGYLESIQNSPCYIPPVNPDDASDFGKLKENCYELLAPIPGLEALGAPNNNSNAQGFEDGVFTDQFSIGFWINRMVAFITGLIGLAAVIMIVIAGVQYMTTESIGTKTGAKDRIVNSLIGLVIALSIFVILNTINPNLLKLDPDIATADLAFEYPTEYELEGDTGEPTYKWKLTPDQISEFGFDCPGSGGTGKIQDIVNSFDAKDNVTYRYGAKGDVAPYAIKSSSTNLCEDPISKEKNKLCHTWCPEGTYCVDCSGFVFHVLKCAGINALTLGTNGMVSNERARHLISMDIPAETYIYSVSGTPTTDTFKIGDLLVWNGHVVMYMGNGRIAESAAGSGKAPGKAIRQIDISATSYLSKITHVIPASSW